MNGTAMQLRRGVFAAAVALSLAFGTRQAFADPVPPPADGPRCDPAWCDRFCRLIGAFSGQCTSGGGCACAL